MTDYAAPLALALARCALDGDRRACERLLALAADPTRLAVVMGAGETFSDDDLPWADEDDDVAKKRPAKLFGSPKDVKAGAARFHGANESSPPNFKATEDTQDLGWETAPAGSHVKRFRLILRRFEGLGQPSELWVTFKSGQSRPAPVLKSGKRSQRPTKNYPETTYCYLSGDHGGLHEIYHELARVAHPGVTIWEWLIRPGVPCHGPFWTAPERIVEGGKWETITTPQSKQRPRSFLERLSGERDFWGR